MTIYRRIPLEGVYNLRDLGGYSTSSGKRTAFQRFLRSDDLSAIRDEDKEVLLDYGLRAVLDLRSPLELERSPNPFAEEDDVLYKHISLLGELVPSTETLNEYKDFLMQPAEELLPKMYIHMLEENKAGIREVFDWLSEQETGVLFHCTAGKDRTGVIAMLLLGLAGVCKEDIVANYMVTEVYNAKNPAERTMDLPIELPEDLLQSRPEFIAKAYDFLLDQYGGIIPYLRSTEVEEGSLEALRKNLVD